jgi:hypothetical protein
LKKNGTSARKHWSRMSVTQTRSIGRAPGPDSPPTIAQLIPLKFRLCNGPSNGSSDKNLTTAPRPAQVIDAEGVILVFHAEPHPYILRPLDFGAEFFQPLGAFGQHLEGVPVRAAHYIENFLHKLNRYISFIDKNYDLRPFCVLDPVGYGIIPFAMVLTPAFIPNHE